MMEGKGLTMKGGKLGNRLVHFFTYNVLFALFPLANSLFLHSLGNNEPFGEALAKSPELLFFGLMVSAIAMGDLTDIVAPARWTFIVKILKSALLLGIIWSTFLYSCMNYTNIIDRFISFQIRLLSVTIFLTCGLFLLSLIVEIIIGIIEDNI
jgi:hypothetical protein